MLDIEKSSLQKIRQIFALFYVMLVKSVRLSHTSQIFNTRFIKNIAVFEIIWLLPRQAVELHKTLA